MNKERLVIASALIVVLIIAAAAAYILLLPKTDAKETIKIGIMEPFSGYGAYMAERLRRGGELAVRDFNAGGGLDGRLIETFEIDHKGVVSETLSGFRRLIDQGVIAIQGPYFSSHALALLPILNEEKIVLVQDATSSPTVTEQMGVGGCEWAFRTRNDDRNSIKILIALLSSPPFSYKTFSLVGTDDTWGHTCADLDSEFITQEGGTVLSNDFHALTETDFTSLLTKIKNLGSDCIITANDVEALAPMLRQRRELGITVGFANIGGAAVDPSLPTLVTVDELEGLVSVSEWVAGEAQAFEASYEKVYGEPPEQGAVWGYNAMQTIIMGIEAAGSTNTTALRDAIKQLEFASATGATINFDDHNQVLLDSYLIEWKAGNVTVVSKYSPGG